MTAILTNHLQPLLQEKAGHHMFIIENEELMLTNSLHMFPTCLSGGLCCKVGCKLFEDVGHLLLHKKTNEVGGCVEL